MRCNNAVYHMMCVMRCGLCYLAFHRGSFILNTRPSGSAPMDVLGAHVRRVGFAVKIFGIGRPCVRGKEGGIFVSPSSHRGESGGLMRSHAPRQPVRSYLRADAQR